MVSENVSKSRTKFQQKDQYKGLCPLCELRNVCNYPKSEECPVTQCDEFKGIVTIQLDKLFKANEQSISHEEEIYGKYKKPTLLGLCKTCAISECCTFPKPESGIWHCKEYS